MNNWEEVKADVESVINSFKDNIKLLLIKMDEKVKDKHEKVRKMAAEVKELKRKVKKILKSNKTSSEKFLAVVNKLRSKKGELDLKAIGEKKFPCCEN